MVDSDRLRALYPNIPAHEWNRGACGVGMIANMDGRPTRGLVDEALDALGCLTHRGASSYVDDADPGTSDGAGIMFDIHAPYLLSLFRVDHGTAPAMTLDADHPVGLGMLFLPRDRECEARGLVDRSMRAMGIRVLGWRDVPVTVDVLGRRARDTMPTVIQVLVERPEVLAPRRFEQLLYRARRRIERRAARDELNLTVVSLSSHTVVYKGLVQARSLGEFYDDLRDGSMEVSTAMYHQRYATNTLPDWSLAQPFHRLCHNGEINTLMGNRGWVAAREHALSPTMRRRFSPLLGDVSDSDSIQLDRLVEALTLEGVPPVQAILGLVPEAHAANSEMHPQLRAWYQVQGAMREAWDGPAALLYCDERWAVAHLDRNGLRPLFVEETRGNGHPSQLAVSSEQGVTAHQHDDIIYSHQLGPGEIVALDRLTGRCYHDKEIKAELVALTDDWQSIADRHVVFAGIAPVDRQRASDGRFLNLQIAAGATQDDLTYFMLPMVRKGKEAVWSMGDDSQLTPFVSRPRMFADHLRQRFAQVTNPPIDPYRERAVFDMTVYLGRLEGFFGGPIEGRSIALETPILSDERYAWISGRADVAVLSTTFPVDSGVAGAAEALDRLECAAVEAAREGCAAIILSDRGCDAKLHRTTGVDEHHVALPTALAIGAIHQRLVERGLRTRVGLVIDAADAWHEHHLAVLLGLGADAIHPWMALRWAEALSADDDEAEADPGGARLRRVLESGVVKVMSKMGICAAASYVGSQLFEALGLEADLVARCCPGVARWGQGVDFAELIGDVIGFHQAAWAPRAALSEQGFVRYRKGGLPRAFEPRVFSGLPRVLAETESEMQCVAELNAAPPEEFVATFLETLEPDARRRYAEWSSPINTREPVTVADRYQIESDRAPIPVEQVEPVWRILDDRDGLGRICGGAMSWGSLSDEAHEDIAIAMNRVGAKSNTGEGGERPYRFGGPANSAIKQVASARFGVTPQYLHHLHEWQIKMAQGSKPGEGGQLPGHKVSAAIAEVRGSSPGVELISPPPHHDIYSIEDLAELMYELSQFNPNARGNVKLVSETGVAIVAAGVAKGGAQTVHVSGHSGGTGASPLSSIKFAGLPWELGVQSAHQILHANDLRDRVKLVVDGGVQTGRQAIKAFLLGAEAVALGSILLVAEGCIMARQCHLNTCPTGIATQSKQFRAKYAGKPVHLIKFLLLFAEEVRETLAAMGYRSVGEIVGRSDLLRPRGDVDGAAARIRFDDDLLRRPLPLAPKRIRRPSPSALNLRLVREAQPALEDGESVAARHIIVNTDRAVGATLANAIVAATGSRGLANPIHLEFEGFAGQALGFAAWGGLHITLHGRANDYVGKSMSTGAVIAVRPPDSIGCPPESTSLVGNTVGYGATGGELYVAGRAGQRFMCRNSGASAVVEGVGPHGCEYMTKGIVVVLGSVGLNFAAGMTGGAVYMIDGFTAEERGLLNTDYVRVEPLRPEEHDTSGPLYQLISAHYRWTNSPLAADVLRYWPFYARYRFDKVVSIVPRATVSDD